MTPTRRGDESVARARLAKAQEFASSASLLLEPDGNTDRPDAFVTIAVHAGIAAADVICVRHLGEYSATGAHDEAVQLLRRVDERAAMHLRRLLSVKAKAGYSVSRSSHRDVAIAQRAHRALLELAAAS